MSGIGTFSNDINGCTFERKTAGNKIVFWMARCPKGDAKTSRIGQLNTVKEILHILKVPKTETTLTENAARIDWKDKKYSMFKIAIRCVSHKKRANEPPPQRSQNNRRRGHQGRQQHQGRQHQRQQGRNQQGKTKSNHQRSRNYSSKNDEKRSQYTGQ